MRKAAPNPYRDASLEELRSACVRCIGTIEDRSARSPEERREFAEDVRHLLIAAATRFTTGHYTSAEPENAVERDPRIGVVAAFGAWHRRATNRLQREQRSLTLQRAANYVLGRGAEDWIHPTGRLHPGDRGSLAIESDEALETALAELDAIFQRRQAPPR